MQFAVVDEKMAGVRMVVMEGFEDSLTESEMEDTGDCVCSEKVDEKVRLYGVWDIALVYIFADGEIAAMSMVVMEGFEGNVRECVMGDTGDCVWGSGVDIGNVRLCHVWGVVVFAAVQLFSQLVFFFINTLYTMYHPFTVNLVHICDSVTHCMILWTLFGILLTTLGKPQTTLHHGCVDSQSLY